MSQAARSVPSDFDNAYGFIGVVIILAGIPGALISGIVPDWAKQFRMVTRVLYVLAMLSMVLLCVVVEFGSLSLIYPAAAFFGATTSLISSGFELAAEITYPIPEATTAGLLNSSAQILGVIVSSSLPRADLQAGAIRVEQRRCCGCTLGF